MLAVPSEELVAMLVQSFNQTKSLRLGLRILVSFPEYATTFGFGFRVSLPPNSNCSIWLQLLENFFFLRNGFSFLNENNDRFWFFGWIITKKVFSWKVKLRERPLALWRGGEELSGFGVDSKGSHYFFIAANVFEAPALVLCEFLRRRHWRAQRAKHSRSLCVCVCERQKGAGYIWRGRETGEVIRSRACDVVYYFRKLFKIWESKNSFKRKLINSLAILNKWRHFSKNSNHMTWFTIRTI